MPKLRPPLPILAALALATATAPSARAAHVVVRADGSGDFVTIQAAIDAAAEGDTVLVGAGTWNESLLIDGRSVALVGDGAPESVVLDAGWAHRILEIRRCGEPVRLENLVFRRGRAGGVEFPAAAGGAILARVSPVRAVGCVFEECFAVGTGGAIHVALGIDEELGFPRPVADPADLRLLLDGCRFTANRAGSEGGGVYADSAPLTAVATVFTGNQALQGGGMSLLQGRATIAGGRFEANLADTDGGALRLAGAGPFTLDGVDLKGNVADRHGGAVRGDFALAVVLTDTVILDSRASFDGGAVSFRGGALSAERVLFAGSAGAETGGGVQAAEGASLTFVRCTWIGNAAERASSVAITTSSASFDRCLLADAGEDAVRCFSGAQVGASCCAGPASAGSCVGVSPSGPVELCVDDPRRLCAPVTLEGCGTVGHADASCPPETCETPVEPVSWGAIKRRYR